MYVPPSRRAGYTTPSSSTLPPDYRPRPAAPKPGTEFYTASNLSRHFTHPQDSSITFFSHPLPPYERPPRAAYDPTRTADDSPLPPSPPTPGPPHVLKHLVSYIVLFPNAHPDWDSAGELWVHTNAERLMEDYEEDGGSGRKRNFGRPIPVFKGVHRQSENLEFVGWYQIDKLRVVPPDSDELKELLQRKEAARSYTRAGRSAAAWAASLREQWIKLRLNPSPPSSSNHTALENPMKLKGGDGGEVERYLLKVGGLDEEMAILEQDQVLVEDL